MAVSVEMVIALGTPTQLSAEEDITDPSASK
jgi:hypothetical protein